MNTITEKTNQSKTIVAVLGLALLSIAALAVTLAGGAQAQTPDNTYADPQPCGPGADTAFQPEPHEITSGHFALFDAYWQWWDSNPNTGVLHTNLCPPLVSRTTETDDFGQTTTVTTMSESGIDVGEAIFHVLDKHKATVVRGDIGDNNTSHLRLDQYEEVGDYADAGDEVWWLRLDDPHLAGDQSSDLTIGFSTMRFDSQYWGGAEDGGATFRYKFELERNPGIAPSEHPHFLAYRQRELGLLGAELVWDSAAADTKDMELEPGQFENLQWVFTKSGTYEISVHLQGWVRRANNPLDGAADDWSPISPNVTETSEVRRYVIHVGSALAEVEPPRFGLSYSIRENSPAGTALGTPISIFESEVDDLEYRLSGEGSDDFALVSTANPHTVQVVVADGALLDFETRESYDLTLSVTDNLDHESNPNSAIDDSLAVRVALEDIPTSAVIHVDNPNPSVGETVTFTPAVTDFGHGHYVHYKFTDSSGIYDSQGAHTIQRDSPTTETVSLTVWYRQQEDDPESPAVELHAQSVTVTWSNP